MKFSAIYSVAGFAASALAAPLLDGTIGGLTGTVGGLTGTVQNIAGSVVDVEGLTNGVNVKRELLNTVGGTAGGVVGTVEGVAGSVVDVKGLTKGVNVKREITDAAGLLSTFKSSNSEVSSITAVIKDITSSVESGDMTKQIGALKGQEQLKKLEVTLTALVKELAGGAGIDVSKGELKKLTTSVNTLLSEVLVTVNGLVTVLGLTPILISIVSSVVGLVTKVLILVIGLVAAIVPGVVAGLTPLLAGIGNGLLVPLLTPIAALLAGLAA